MANRHDVIIWDADVHGAPDGFTKYTYEKAYALIKQPAKPSKKLLAFARDVEKYSTSNDVPAVVGRYFVGFEDNIKSKGTAAYCFNLPEYNWQSIVKILLKEAIKHGLALFDEEIILALLPNGTILPENSRKSWLQLLNAPKQKNAFPETVTEFYTLVKTQIGALLAEHDFVLDRDELSEYGEEFYINYVRQILSGNHQISFDCRGGDGQFTLDSYFKIVENTINNILQSSDFKFAANGSGGVYFDIANILSSQEDRFKIYNWESFDELSLTLKQTALTWSDATLDIKGIDALLNGDVEKKIREKVHQHIFMPYALIVARLANNPNFDDLAVSLGNAKRWSATQKVSPTIAWPKLVQYLKEDINPETFFQQYALVREEEKRLDELRIQQLITQFQLNPNETFIPVSDQWYDAKQNLIWQRCNMGQHWQYGQKIGSEKIFNEKEKNDVLAQCKGKGWRLPTVEELKKLSISFQVGYVTQHGIGFYEQVENRFTSWIEPHNSSSQLKEEQFLIMTVHPETASGVSASGIQRFEKNLRGVLRLVKSVSH